MDHSSSWAILVAAGSGQRFGNATPKQFLEINRKKIFEYSLAVLQASKLLDGVVLVMHQDYLSQWQYLASDNLKIVSGGALRQDSVALGLTMVPATCKWVLIHDAARPLLTENMIATSLAAAQSSGAAVSAAPIADTLKKVDDIGQVLHTVDRNNIFASLTPQVFRKDLLVEGLQMAKAKGWQVTDEAMLMEQMGVTVKIALADNLNIKITRPEDLQLAELILRTKQHN